MSQRRPAKASNLVLDKTGVWYARWWTTPEPGVQKEHRRSLKTRVRRDAEKAVKAVMAEVNAIRHGLVVPDRDAEGPTWEELVQLFREDETYPRKEATRKRYEMEFPRVGAFLKQAEVKPAQITKQTVGKFVSYARKQSLSASSIKNAITAWSRVMDAAAEAGKVERNQVLEYDRKRIRKDEKEMDPPLSGEFERMQPELQAYDPDLALLADFLHRTGARLGEALAAVRTDIFQDDRGDWHIHFHSRVKGDRRRSPLLNSAEALLPRLPARGRLFPCLPEDVAVVSSRFALFFTKRAEEEKAAAAREGREVEAWKLRRWRIHDLRHAFAINAILEDADIYALQHHLGHASVTTTERYLKAMDQMKVRQRRGLRLGMWTKGRTNPAAGGEQPDIDISAAQIRHIDRLMRS